MTDKRIEPLKRVLEQMMARDRSEMSFVLLAIIELSCFIQYRGSNSEPLLLVVEIKKMTIPFGLNPDDARITDAAAAGLAILDDWVRQSKYPPDKIEITMEEVQSNTIYKRSILGE